MDSDDSAAANGVATTTAESSASAQPAAPGNPSLEPPRLPSLRSSFDPEGGRGMSHSSTPLGNLNAARHPVQASSYNLISGGATEDALERAKAYSQSRQGPPLRMPGFPPVHALSTNQIPTQASSSSARGPMGPAMMSPNPMKPNAFTGGFRGAGGPILPQGVRPQTQNWQSSPNMRQPLKMGGLAAKRGLNKGLKLSDITHDSGSGSNADKKGSESNPAGSGKQDNPLGSAFTKYSEFVDTKAGTLNFKNKAVIHQRGIDFTGGQTYSISLDEVDTLDELGKGNYGTVYKVRHSRPHMRIPGQGLRGNKPNPAIISSKQVTETTDLSNQMSKASLSPQSTSHRKTTGVIMAMKEIRLELDESKFAAIIMELDVLHRCISPYIIDFYGAFFQEGAVYICMEFMDGGSIDKLYGDGIPENILRKITLSTVMGLKSLKEEHNIIHRDVKPTNILVDTRGQVKICDFGVSGNLVASIAKTNIGCQSYMAPERIASGGISQAGAKAGNGTYSVQSDIWSLGLTVIECAIGRYPYPPETYNNIFSQLSAIVDGEPPDLPDEGYSAAAKDFVRGCLNKIPNLRPTYPMLLRHAWLAPLLKPDTISEEDEDVEMTSNDDARAEAADKEVADWVIATMAKKKAGRLGIKDKAAPALHAAPLDQIPSPKTDHSFSS